MNKMKESMEDLSPLYYSMYNEYLARRLDFDTTKECIAHLSKKFRRSEDFIAKKINEYYGNV